MLVTRGMGPGRSIATYGFGGRFFSYVSNVIDIIRFVVHFTTKKVFSVER